jgi:hypothetical protein
LVKYFDEYERPLVEERKAGRLKRKVFWAAGVSDLWCVDQHDKWKQKFGLALHCCVDPFTGVMKWLKVWWNNNNPHLIFAYYIQAVKTGGCEFIYGSGQGIQH